LPSIGNFFFLDNCFFFFHIFNYFAVAVVIVIVIVVIVIAVLFYIAPSNCWQNTHNTYFVVAMLLLTLNLNLQAFEHWFALYPISKTQFYNRQQNQPIQWPLPCVYLAANFHWQIENYIHPDFLGCKDPRVWAK
jgi:hypothetical protein